VKILLSYSRYHFEPGVKSERPGSSAHILARSLYEILSRLGKVTYIDPKEVDSVRGQSFDLFVGQIDKFAQIVEATNTKRSVLFAVNMHPRSRNKILKDFVRTNNLGAAALTFDDIVSEQNFGKSVEVADHILCVGNMAVYNSYISQGVPRNKVRMVNYGTGNVDNKALKAKRTPKSFVYVVSEVGLRKGFDIIDDIVRSAKDKELQLHIVGTANNPYYADKLVKLTKDFPKQVTDHGWVESSSKEYTNILREVSFVIHPGLEEGQAGTVIDALREGVVPILTPTTGIDFSPVGNLEPKLSSEVNTQVIKKALGLDVKQLSGLREKTIEYYQEFHEGYLDKLENAVKDCAAGNTYPLVSAVLPIFNKEQTILPLLRRFTRAANVYGNMEMHIIIDGCKDNTEKLVRQYYKKDRGYKVRFDVTPNIFEVKTNNMGLKAAKGQYGMILQDDNYIDSPDAILEAVSFMLKSSKAVILGGLAGVNFYPRGTKSLKGKGQITNNANEVYWRQDADTDATLAHKVFEVDACMRGPLFIEKSFLEEHGYLDETYAPFYQDDMDLAFRARKYGKKVYSMLLNVENRSLTVATYSPAREKFWNDTITRNTQIFYDRWTPTKTKDYLAVNRVSLFVPVSDRAAVRAESVREKATTVAQKVGRRARRLVKRPT